MLRRIPGPPLDPAEKKLLSAFTRLKEVSLRQKWEKASGVYIAESANVIARAVAAGHEPLAFLVSSRWVEPLLEQLARDGIDPQREDLPIFVMSVEQTEQITGFPVHRGSLGLFARPELADVEAVLEAAKLAAGGSLAVVGVLEGLVDHTNVGAIFRSAAALGVNAVVLSPDCADPLYRRAVRVSMGAVFQIPWTRLTAWPDASHFHSAGFELVGLTPAPAAVSLEECFESLSREPTLRGVALLLGSEGPGLTREALEVCDRQAQIPLSAGVDSLNVAAAAAIAFWEARRLKVRARSEPPSIQ